MSNIPKRKIKARIILRYPVTDNNGYTARHTYHISLPVDIVLEDQYPPKAAQAYEVIGAEIQPDCCPVCGEIVDAIPSAYVSDGVFVHTRCRDEWHHMQQQNCKEG